MSSNPSNPPTVRSLAQAKGNWAEPRWISDFRQRLGTSGDTKGTDGRARLTFAYGLAVAAALVATINSMNVISDLHDPHVSPFGPLVWEISSWITAMAFFWIIWVAFRLAPPFAGSRLKLLIHIPGALSFALAHVSGFLALRTAAYSLAGAHYVFGRFWPNFAYELRKDVIGYGFFVAVLAFIDHLLRQQQVVAKPESSPTIDIRDGAGLKRVRLDEVLAVGSAGNYVEFILRDGRRLMTRSRLSALGYELDRHGFVRTHRSWIVNSARVTGLKPEGSGDYAVEIGTLTVPLSRRFPSALSRLKAPVSILAV